VGKNKIKTIYLQQPSIHVPSLPHLGHAMVKKPTTALQAEKTG